MEQIFEGTIIGTEGNVANLERLANGESMPNDVYIEAECFLCKHDDLVFSFGKNKGVIHPEELSLYGQPKRGAFLVNKSVGFYVIGTENNEDGSITYILSRKAVQKQYFDAVVKHHKKLDIIKAKVSTLQKSAAFVDIGYGLISVVRNIDASIVRISDMNSFFAIGEEINVIVRQPVTEEDPFIYVTHKELLGTWEQNAEGFEVGDTVIARISYIKDYGIFVALTDNLVALADPLDEDCGLKEDDMVSVTIRCIAPATSKIKAKINMNVPVKHSTGVPEKKYFLDYPFAEKDNKWVYNEYNEAKLVVTDFN